jgi:superfamily II DNA helicase RecQ
LTAAQRSWPGLDHLGAIQASGGLSIGLIALFSSYDHITAFGRSIDLQQQWGVFFIVASVATVVVDAQLATRSRLRAAQDAERMADEANRERDLAGEERQRADQERNRAAEARERQAETAERQRKSFERLDQAALLSARVQLDPSPTNRDRLRAFLTLMAQRPLEDGDAGMA